MSRLEWILGIVLVLLLIVVAALSLMFWFGPNTADSGPAANSGTVIARRAGEIAPTSVFEGDTAKVAYAKAQQTAADWQPDAQLLNARATWPQGANVEQLREGDATWGFTFYSPAAGQISTISVVEEDVSVVSQGDHQPDNSILEATGWNIDSNEVIELFLKEGGRQFLDAEGVTTLAMILHADDLDADGRMKWELNMINLQNGRGLKMQIDATSGEILENRTVP